MLRHMRSILCKHTAGAVLIGYACDNNTRIDKSNRLFLWQGASPASPNIIRNLNPPIILLTVISVYI